MMTPIEAVEFFSREHVTASFSPDYLGTSSTDASGILVHDICQFTLAAEADGQRVTKKSQLIDAICNGSSVSKGSRRSEIIRKKIKLIDLPKGELSLPAMVRSGLTDKDFVRGLAKTFLRKYNLNLEIPKNYKFELIRISDGFVVDTDLDFANYSKLINANHATKNQTISAASVFSEYAEAQRHAYYASSYLGELVTGPTSAKIIQQKVAGLLDKRNNSSENLDTFREMILPNAVSVRRIINNGEKSISDFFHLLDKADRFRDWLHQQPDDISVVHEYHKAISKISWLHKRPTKIARFAAFTGGGMLLNPIIGATLSTADSLLFDKLLSGWKPNQFINGPLENFLNPKT